MYQLWPSSDPTALDDAALARLYLPADRLPADRTQPVVRVNLVTSLDGAVALNGRSAGLSGPADKRVFGLLRTGCDALLVGAGTARVEEYGALELGPHRRALRRDLGLPENPPLVLLSRDLTLDPRHQMFSAAPVRPIVITCAAGDATRRAALARVADVIIAGEHTVDLARALKSLRERGLRQLLCEGGPRVFGALTAADLVDELCLTMSPLLAGAGPGRLSAGPPSAAPRQLALRHLLVAGGVLLLRYTRDPADPGDSRT